MSEVIMSESETGASPKSPVIALPKVGDTVKVRLPGKTPWAVCVEVRENSWMGCIINKLFREYSEFEQAKWLGQEWGKGFVKLPELHKYNKSDVLEFM
jgi:hypothetical protein